MLEAILFDLDGTLLPMDNDLFTKVYFGYLAETASKWGYTDKEKLISGILAGVKSMVKNNGTKPNEQAFWETFSAVIGKDCSDDIKRFDSFYENEFEKAREITGDASRAKEAVNAAHEKAKHVILASNPIFPRVGTKTRLSWAGLTPEDFDWVTEYSNSCFCKPNPEYYRDILNRFGLTPSNCLMVGNDMQEDFAAASSLGIPCFIVTDNLINRTDEEIACPHGTYSDMIEYIKSLRT
ncbi:MAG: HAD family hydrolase [Oscillospiraceae bacterium]|nr:HAD family hydrolase [Oscillospiraceae bacterium]